MEFKSLEQLIDLSQADLEVLKTLGHVGAATAEEVALQMDRPGDDLSPQIHQLVQRKLVEARTTTIGDETIEVYIVDPLVRKKLQT